jgi:hypothetical protein
LLPTIAFALFQRFQPELFFFFRRERAWPAMGGLGTVEPF